MTTEVTISNATVDVEINGSVTTVDIVTAAVTIDVVASGGLNTIAAALDTVFTNPAQSDIVSYDTALGKWINLPLGDIGTDWTVSQDPDVIHADNYIDTVYNDTVIQAEVDLNTAKLTNIDHPLVETAVPAGAVFTDTTYTAGDFAHDSLASIPVNDHLDWTADQGAKDIHANNYIDTQYTHPTTNDDWHVSDDGTNDAKVLTATTVAGVFTWEVPSGGGSSTLESLTDTSVVSEVFGQVLSWNGSAWQNKSLANANIATTSHVHALGSISDVTITGALTGDIIAYNGSAWVDLTAGANGLVLSADSTEPTGLKWISAGGTGDMQASVYDPNTIGLDAFDMTNMVESTTDKILTSAERSLIASALQSEANDLSTVTWVTVPDLYVSESSVIQHVAAIDHDSLLNFAAGEHRTINDAGTLTTELFSANKIISDLSGKSDTGHTHVKANITDFNETDYATGAEGDLATSALQNITGEAIGSLSDVTIATPAVKHFLAYDGASDWVNRVLVEADISDFGTYLTSFTELNDLGSNVTWINVPDANITESSVIQHVGAIVHDSLSGFVANEHIDWTVSQGATDIHADNYTKYTHPTTNDDWHVSDDGTNNTKVLTASGVAGTFTWEAPSGGGGALNDLTDVTITGAVKGDVLAYNGSAWVDVTVGTNGQFLTADSAEVAGVKWSTSSGSGDMLAATYDPTTVAGDAFDMENMIEGATKKILTATERTSIGTALQADGSVDGTDQLFAGHVAIGEDAIINTDELLTISGAVSDVGGFGVAQSAMAFVANIEGSIQTLGAGIVGIQETLTYNATPLIQSGEMRGIVADIVHDSVSTINSQIGIDVTLETRASSGQVANSYGVIIGTDYTLGAGAASVYGVRIDNLGGSNVNNSYGMYITTQTVGGVGAKSGIRMEGNGIGCDISFGIGGISVIYEHLSSHLVIDTDIQGIGGKWLQIEGDAKITGTLEVQALGTGGLTDIDLYVGDALDTPTYGMMQIGNAMFGRTSYTDGVNLDLDGSVILWNKATPATSNIEFAFAESSNSIRFAIPKSGVGNATYNPRSMLLAGDAPADDAMVTVGYWQGQGIFDNLTCDTSTSGADLGVQNDLEVEGDIFTDSIKESTTAAGVTIDGLLVKDSGIPEAAVTAHQAALSVTKSQVSDFVETDYATGAEGDLATSALQSVAGDTTPELGGALDCLNKDIDNAKTITFNGEINNSGTGAQTVNWTSGQKQNFTLTGATTISFTAPIGVCNLQLKLINPSTNITWGTTIKWVGGTQPTWTTTGEDIVSIYFDGTNYYGMAGIGFA